MFRGARPITLLHIVTSKGFEGGAFQDSTYLSTLDPGGEPFHCIGRIIGDQERTEYPVVFSVILNHFPTQIVISGDAVLSGSVMVTVLLRWLETLFAASLAQA